MKILQMADAVRYPAMSTRELRETFLVDALFQPGQVNLVYVDLDRTVIGSAVPTAEPLTLPCPPELRATHFNERRELAVLNIGAPGTVTVDGTEFALANLDALYIGRGAKQVSFASANSIGRPGALAPGNPGIHEPIAAQAAVGPTARGAEMYLLSYPAHATYPTQPIRSAEIEPVQLGAPETANARAITKLIHLEGTRSCQLVMGFTQLAPGSVWNTMPPHTHMRRSEVYLYFNLAPEQRVVHLMGPAPETRHLVVANKQVVVSPGWSIHAGVGTSSYTFCWGMGGENQVYTDMDALTIADLL